tara:strand:- start:61 stop:564 length:504 start_codon:yes stop_codon:yes gene_type:complete
MAVTDQDITSSLSKPCKDNQGGLQTVYIFPYVKYSRSQVSLLDELIISYPSINVYEYEASQMSFSENAKITDGGVEWSQSLSFKIPVIDRNTEVNKLNYKDYCVIFRDRQNVLRLMGLWNGATIETSSTSGGSKGSFSGYDVKVQAKEAKQASYILPAYFNARFTIQ